MLTCKICGLQEPHYLGRHLLDAHQITGADYQSTYPGQEITSPVFKSYLASRPIPARNQPPEPDKLSVSIAGMDFPVNYGVPESVCLPAPEHYRLPGTSSKETPEGRGATPVAAKSAMPTKALKASIQSAVLCIYKCRATYIWGNAGTGKDAFVSWLSHTCRIPAILRQVQPGADIESWLYTRAFNEKGTYWEEGAVLKALRDGYLTTDGRRVPYMLVLSDADRLDRSQAEMFRLILDSISKRVSGPRGETYPVLPGTRIVATANSPGSGDSRGRYVSSNVMDASLFDRFERKIEFGNMPWEDERIVVENKFPLIARFAPKVFDQMGKVTAVLREAIAKEQLYAEFSHRGLCSILGHINDIIEVSGKVPDSIVKMGTWMWLDGLPDEQSRQAAWALIDPHLAGGVMQEGDTTFIKGGPARKAR